MVNALKHGEVHPAGTKESDVSGAVWDHIEVSRPPQMIAATLYSFYFLLFFTLLQRIFSIRV